MHTPSLSLLAQHYNSPGTTARSLPLLRLHINFPPNRPPTRDSPSSSAAMAPAPRLRWAVLAAALLLSLSTTTMCAGAAQHVSAPPSAATAAAAPAPAAAMDAACLNSLLNMSDCLPYVQAGSAMAARPDPACCPELAGLVDSNPICLCELLSGAADSYGIAVDYSRALALPGVCRVATPPVSTCAALGYNVRGLAPSSAPAVSPSGEGPQFPGSSPFASPPAPSTSHAASLYPAASGNLITLAALLLAAAAATGMMF